MKTSFFLFEDKIFNVTDGERIVGDKERFFFGIRERLDSKEIYFEQKKNLF